MGPTLVAQIFTPASTPYTDKRNNWSPRARKRADSNALSVTSVKQVMAGSNPIGTPCQWGPHCPDGDPGSMYNFSNKESGHQDDV